MKHIVTLTLNPTVDKSTTVAQMIPEQKLRCTPPKFEPGGGGINVSRALKRLGVDSLAIFPASGTTGLLLQQLLSQEDIAQQPVVTVNWTRENFIVVDTSTNHQYRFGMPGSELSEIEQQQILDTLAALTPAPDYLIISGSLPPGVEPAFLGKVVRLAHTAGSKVIADTSGPALHVLLAEGIYLVKPNIGELSRLANQDDLDSSSVDTAARQLIERGQCEIVVTSLGAQGACLVTRDIIDHVPAPAVKKRSTVGAGDSMVAGLVYALSIGKSVREAVRLGVACGSAATMNPGTELFYKEDAERLYRWLLRSLPEQVSERVSE